METKSLFQMDGEIGKDAAGGDLIGLISTRQSNHPNASFVDLRMIDRYRLHIIYPAAAIAASRPPLKTAYLRLSRG